MKLTRITAALAAALLLAVAGAVIDALHGLDLDYPELSKHQRAQLDEARASLEGQRQKE